jgi:hypothetical protein
MSLRSRIERLDSIIGRVEELVWVTAQIRILGTPGGYWVPKSFAERPNKIVLPRYDPRYAPPGELPSHDEVG